MSEIQDPKVNESNNPRESGLPRTQAMLVVAVLVAVCCVGLMISRRGETAPQFSTNYSIEQADPHSAK